MLVASVTHSITTAIGNHGIYAVFGLMAIDAVFPAASELVMIYGGALAGGAIAGSQVILFGHPMESNFGAFVAVSLAGMVDTTSSQISKEIWQAINLTNYAVETRYPGPAEPVNRNEYREAVALAQQVVNGQKILSRPSGGNSHAR